MSENAIKIYGPYSGRKSIQCRLNISSKMFHDKGFLSKFGIVPRKTYEPVLPNIPDKYKKSFLLGFIDADGHVDFGYYPNKYGRKNYRVNELDLVNNPTMADWYEQELRTIGYDGNFTYANPKLTARRIRIRNRKDFFKIINLLDILNHKEIILSRKWKSTIDYLSPGLDPV